MSDLVRYAVEDGVATITLDDGKVNALSPAMQAAINGALDRAQDEAEVVVLTGRETTFSAGFDLRAAPEEWPEMVAGGGDLAGRLLAFPLPTIAACNGNAIAMGSFLLLSCDVRIGVAGPFRIAMNEVAIGLTLPFFAVALSRHRLSPPFFDRCANTGVAVDPAEAVAAGFLDRAVAAEALAGAAAEAAAALKAIDRNAHAATKLRVRERVIAEVREGVERLRGGEF